MKDITEGISEKAYNEWKEQKLQQEREQTKNSERVKGDEPIFMEFAINKHCFKMKPQINYVPLYWASEELLSEYPDSIGIAGYGRILFNREIWDELDTKTRIAAVFHEMLHVYCQMRRIKDTENGYHLRKFAEIAEQNGGYCTLSEDGWTEAYPTDENMKKILAELKKDGIKIRE